MMISARRKFVVVVVLSRPCKAEGVKLVGVTLPFCGIGETAIQTLASRLSPAVLGVRLAKKSSLPGFGYK